MEAEAKHYRFINSKTGNVIYHYTINQALTPEQTDKQLNTIKAEVAVSNGVYLDTIYWEEVKGN